MKFCVVKEKKYPISLGFPMRAAKITSAFGERVHPITKVKSMHFGVDFAPVNDKKIRAAHDGEIIFVRDDKDKGYGKWINQIFVVNKLTFFVFYAHLEKFLVTEGKIKKGQEIGICGNTGASTKKNLHLHFGIMFEKAKDEFAFNPIQYFFGA